MAKVTALRPNREKPAFNPEANYKWEPTDIFEITGQQLAAFYHCLSREINDAQGASIALKYEAFNTVLEVFRRGVEQGAIIEMGDPMQSLSEVEEIEQNVDKLFKGNRNPDTLPHWHPNS
jgi:hypothetical protein